MSSLLSRYAESVFWMARYFERAESLARVIETQTSFQRGREDTSWAWIVALYSDEKAFAKAFPETTAENVIRYYMAYIDNPGSIQSSIRSARENARALRPMLSTDMWYQLNDFCNRLFAFAPNDFSEVRLSRTCDAIKRGCYAQIGVAENTLYHDETWPFFKLGLYLERADQTSRLLDVRFAQQQTGMARDEGQFDFTFWTILLRAASAYHSYRRVFPRHIDPHEVARFMIFDPRLPRSIAFCLGEDPGHDRASAPQFRTDERRRGGRAGGGDDLRARRREQGRASARKPAHLQRLGAAQPHSARGGAWPSLFRLCADAGDCAAASRNEPDAIADSVCALSASRKALALFAAWQTAPIRLA